MTNGKRSLVEICGTFVLQVLIARLVTLGLVVLRGVCRAQYGMWMVFKRAYCLLTICQFSPRSSQLYKCVGEL